MRFSRREAFVEGRNLAIAFRWADGRYDSLPALAAELVDLPVTLIFAAGGPPTAFAVKAATSKIPIVFSAVSDPVEIGLGPSLNQPGGNSQSPDGYRDRLRAFRQGLKDAGYTESEIAAGGRDADGRRAKGVNKWCAQTMTAFAKSWRRQ